MCPPCEDGLGRPQSPGPTGRERGASVVMPMDIVPGSHLAVQTPDGETGFVEVPEGAVGGQTMKLNMKMYDAGGDQLVELVRPTPDTRRGVCP